jgi:hypothetical protein
MGVFDYISEERPPPPTRINISQLARAVCPRRVEPSVSRGGGTRSIYHIFKRVNDGIYFGCSHYGLDSSGLM